MYAFLGEKNVRIVDLEKIDFSMSYDDFLKNYSETNEYKIIIDKSNIDFFIDTLKNCNIIDAHRALYCKRKTMNLFSEDAFLVSKDNFSLFKKEDFYMQTNVMSDVSFYEKIDRRNGVFPTEYIIAEFCRTITPMTEKTWWMYVAEHKSSGIKIVSGIGRGIVVSRIIPRSSDSDAAVLQTIKYLKRYGLKDEIKVISPIKGLTVADQTIDILALKDKRDAELMLLEFFSTKNIRSVFALDNHFRLFLRNHLKEFYMTLCICLVISISLFFYLQNKIFERKKNILNLERSMCVDSEDLSHTFRVKINDKNFSYIQQVIKISKESKNPLTSIKIVSDILKETAIVVEAISLEKRNFIKLKCILNKCSLEKLKKSSSDYVKIQVTKIGASDDEYEGIEDSHDKNFGAEICIETK